ncbi:concanavalin A-like lectin/glucanase [Teratosphaeria nubilosa]|uniref:Concanavalin A-like lectin/glucanase n=1 Tax=Teratosphaeria nubilosa TaxID=161662 RepID=A0A6G1KVP7_9PEZI|nr:concanavalin A-like lectin/glucanase [Teratosphaeria nubilosa]
MYATAFFLAALATAATAADATKDDKLTPPLTPGSTEVCGQYETSEFNGYKISTNGWGWQNGKGKQCSGFTGQQSISNARWYSRWDWTGAQGQIKSYAAIEPLDYPKKYLSEYKSMHTSFDWEYEGNDLAANVAYHLTFQANSNTSGPETFQVQIWLAQYGDISPLSSNGYPYTSIANPPIGECKWDLAFGFNGRTKVYTFLPTDKTAKYTSFKFDLLDFTKYLEDNYKDNGFEAEKLFLKVAFAGSEVFLGTDALFSASSYSLKVES